MKVVDLEDEEPQKEGTQPKPEAWLTDRNLGDAEDCANFAMSMKAHRFTDNVTMHGLRYVFMRDAHFARRLVWVCVVLAGLAYCTYIIYQSWSAFLAFPTVVSIMRKIEAKSEFPSVTICPYNVFRKSQLTDRQEKGLQQVFAYFFPIADPIDLHEFDDMDMFEFYKNSSHHLHVEFCTYKGRHCVEDLFHEVVTDLGICHVFDPSTKPKYKYQNTAGQHNGFNYGEVVYEEDWTYGPFMIYDGFRVAVHPPGTRVYYLRDKGFSLLPGYATDVTIQRRETNLLSPPYGQCGQVQLEYFNEYSREKCILECETRFTVDLCGCRFIYMPGNASHCSLHQLAVCNYLTSDPFANETKVFDQTQCDCPQDCKVVEYDLHVTNTAPTQGYKDLMLENLNLDINQGMQLRLYYTKLQYLEMTETAVYNFERLMCDVGGAGGLFLGISFATMAEFVDFSIEMVWALLLRNHAAKKKRKNQVHSTDK